MFQNFNKPTLLRLSLLICGLTFSHHLAANEMLYQPGQHAVIFGDSITFDGGYGQYVLTVLEARYPEGQFVISSRGSHGDTAAGAMKRVDDEVVALNPDWVLINFGTNDVGSHTVASFLIAYEDLIDEIQAKSNANIGIISPIFPDRKASPKRDVRLAAMVAGLQAMAIRKDLLYIPAYERFKTLRPQLPENFRYAPDSIHPNDVGYWVIAQTILEAWAYPFEPRERILGIASPRVTHARDDTLVGLEVLLPLPEVLRVKVVNWEAPLAVAFPTKSPMRMDGDFSDWDLSQPICLDAEQRMIGTFGRQGHAVSACAWLTYDADGLYFAVEVQDDVIRHSPGSESVFRDNVEFFLDVRNEKQRIDAGPDYTREKFAGVCQILLVPEGGAEAPAIIAAAAGDANLIKGATLGYQKTNTGYRLECHIAADRFEPGMLQPGTILGFDWSVNDLDHSDNFHAVQQLRWSGSDASSFRLDGWGRIRLEE